MRPGEGGGHRRRLAEGATRHPRPHHRLPLGPARSSLGDIEAGTRAALALARELGARSIAFPLLGAGIVGLPRRQVAEAMLRALHEAADLEIVVCAYSRADKEALEGLV